MNTRNKYTTKLDEFLDRVWILPMNISSFSQSCRPHGYKKTIEKQDYTMNFAGFEPSNTTAVPDSFFDELLSELNGSELKALLYIIRRTRGFKKDIDAISYSQFIDGITTKEGRVLDKGCGIKDRTTLRKALDSLEDMGCIVSTKGKDPQGDNATTLYSIHFKEVVGKPDHPEEGGSGQTRPPVVGRTDYGSGQTRPPVVGKPDQQDTVLQQTDSQDTVLQGEKPSKPEFDPKVLNQRVETYRRTLNTFRGFIATWSGEDEKFALDMARAGRTAEEVRLTLQAIKDDPDKFDANHFSMKAVQKRIDTVKQRLLEEQGAQEVQVSPKGRNEEDPTGFGKYVGNGPDERAARKREIAELEAKGEFILT